MNTLRIGVAAFFVMSVAAICPAEDCLEVANAKLAMASGDYRSAVSNLYASMAKEQKNTEIPILLAKCYIEAKEDLDVPGVGIQPWPPEWTTPANLKRAVSSLTYLNRMGKEGCLALAELIKTGPPKLVVAAIRAASVQDNVGCVAAILDVALRTPNGEARLSAAEGLSVIGGSEAAEAVGKLMPGTARLIRLQINEIYAPMKDACDALKLAKTTTNRSALNDLMTKSRPNLVDILTALATRTDLPAKIRKEATDILKCSGAPRKIPLLPRPFPVGAVKPPRPAPQAKSPVSGAATRPAAGAATRPAPALGAPKPGEKLLTEED